MSPPEPTIKRAESVPPSRSLAYEQKIARTNEPAAVPSDPMPQAAAPAAPAHDAQNTVPAEATDAPTAEQDMAALPPDDGAPANDPDALPWQHAARPNYPGSPDMARGPAADPMAEQPGQHDDPAEPMAAVPGEDADPNAWPADPQGAPEEFVQVLVSGVGMHGAPTDDAPMLFAFPYGRTLRVVSRYEGWVEVTDPQSAATGWMKAQYLAPAMAPGAPQEAEQMYDDDEPRGRSRRWLRRHGGGLGDMIGRALGGY